LTACNERWHRRPRGERTAIRIGGTYGG